MMIRKMMLVAFAAAGLLAAAADAGTKGPLTFDFQAASDRMFPKREGVGGNLFKVEDGAFKSTGVALRCIQRKPDPDILKKLEPKVTASFRNGEGLIRIDESAKELFRENPIESSSVYAALRQRVDLREPQSGDVPVPMPLHHAKKIALGLGVTNNINFCHKHSSKNLTSVGICAIICKPMQLFFDLLYNETPR